MQEELNNQEMQSLFVLGYLFLRMGYYKNAEKIFLALLKLESSIANKRWIYKNLAVIAVNQKQYEQALEYLREAIGDGMIKARDAVLYLLKAEALWQSSRKNEAENAIQAYYNIVGKRGS